MGRSRAGDAMHDCSKAAHCSFSLCRRSCSWATSNATGVAYGIYGAPHILPALRCTLELCNEFGHLASGDAGSQDA
jgi:hypothetical protein